MSDLTEQAPPVCPLCQSTNVRPSRMHGVVDRLTWLALPRSPFRCRECGHRFWDANYSAAALLRSAVAAILVVAVVCVALRFV